MNSAEEMLQVIQSAAEIKKESNEKQHGDEYITYALNENWWMIQDRSGGYAVEESEGVVFRDKILRIPKEFFMTVEICEPTEEKSGYRLCTYTPGKIPLLQKCNMFLSYKEDNELHRHDYYEMIYVYQGKRLMQIEDSAVELSAGSVCIFDMQCAHKDLRMQSQGIAFYCCFSGKMMDKWFEKQLSGQQKAFFMSGLDGQTDIRYLRLQTKSDNVEVINKIFADIFMETEKAEIAFERIVQVYILRILNTLTHSETQETVVLPKKLRGTKLFQAVARYISSHIAVISLEMLCEQFHYQEDYYNRLIKRNTGLTYSQYVKSLRLDKAKNLLINTDMSVRGIMEYLGYETHAYFYSIFQKETGMTPREYREEKLQENNTYKQG